MKPSTEILCRLLVEWDALGLDMLGGENAPFRGVQPGNALNMVFAPAIGIYHAAIRSDELYLSADKRQHIRDLIKGLDPKDMCLPMDDEDLEHLWSWGDHSPPKVTPPTRRARPKDPTGQAPLRAAKG